MPALTRTQQRDAEALRKVKQRKALTALNELLCSREVKDMLPQTKISLGFYRSEGSESALYLKQTGLLRESKTASYRSVEYGDASYQEVFSHWDTSESKVKPSPRVIQEFELDESRLRAILEQLKA